MPIKTHTSSPPDIDFFRRVVSLQVDLFRNITFRNSKRTYRGIPVIASNMDTVGTFEMAKVLGKVGIRTY